MAISDYILKIVKKDPFLRLQMSAKEMLIVTNIFSTNKQYIKIKLMQNETNLGSIAAFAGVHKLFYTYHADCGIH